MVVHECHELHRRWRLEWFAKFERFASNRGTHNERNVYADVFWFGRIGESICHCYCYSTSAVNYVYRFFDYC